MEITIVVRVRLYLHKMPNNEEGFGDNRYLNRHN